MTWNLLIVEEEKNQEEKQLKTLSPLVRNAMQFLKVLQSNEKKKRVAKWSYRIFYWGGRSGIYFAEMLLATKQDVDGGKQETCLQHLATAKCVEVCCLWRIDRFAAKVTSLQSNSYNVPAAKFLTDCYDFNEIQPLPIYK